MRCKNCEHEVVQRTSLDGSGTKYYTHKEHIVAGVAMSHSFECPCKKAEVEQ